MHLVIVLLQPCATSDGCRWQVTRTRPNGAGTGAGIELPQIGIDLRDFGIGFRER